MTSPNESHGAGVAARAWTAILTIPVVVAAALTLFAWPQAEPAPRDVPFGVAGAPSESDAIEQGLASRSNRFDVRRYSDEVAAREAVEDRDIYGAIVASPRTRTLLTASAASPVLAELLKRSFTGDEKAGALANRTRVVDVVPIDPDDPRGGAFTASVLPLLLAGIITGFLVSSLSQPGLRWTGTLVAGAALAGLAAVAITQGWLGTIGGNWLINAGAFGLVVLAIASPAAGLTALLGHAGVILTALLMVLVGNPWSGVPSAPELLPAVPAYVGQLLPPGAGGNLLRSTAFFDGAGAAEPLLVLAVWSAAGLVIGWLAGRRGSSDASPPLEERDPGARAVSRT